MIADTQPIIGGPQVGMARLANALHLRADLPLGQADDIVAAYTAIGQLTRIGNLIPFAQAAHETGWFTSERWVRSYNPAGLGATSDGTWGATFASPAEGIAAQYAHLLAYAAADAALNVPQRVLVQMDPRLSAMTWRWGRGSAPRWVDLNGKWAVPGPTYGQAILRIARAIAGEQ